MAKRQKGRRTWAERSRLDAAGALRTPHAEVELHRHHRLTPVSRSRVSGGAKAGEPRFLLFHLLQPPGKKENTSSSGRFPLKPRRNNLKKMVFSTWEVGEFSRDVCLAPGKWVRNPQIILPTPNCKGRLHGRGCTVIWPWVKIPYPQ